jgi:hypothetical protein
MRIPSPAIVVTTGEPKFPVAGSKTPGDDLVKVITFYDPLVTNAEPQLPTIFV